MVSKIGPCVGKAASLEHDVVEACRIVGRAYTHVAEFTKQRDKSTLAVATGTVADPGA